MRKITLLEHQTVWRWHGRSSFEPDESAWEMELLLSVTGLPWDRMRRDPTIRVSVPRTPLLPGVFSASRASSSRRWRDVKVVLLSPQRITDESLTIANAGNEWKVQCVTTQLEPNVLKNPRDGKVKWQDRTWSWTRAAAAAAVEQLQGAAKCTHLEEHEERPKMQGCRVCKTLQRSDLSIARMMRLGVQTCGKLQLVGHAP